MGLKFIFKCKKVTKQKKKEKRNTIMNFNCFSKVFFYDLKLLIGIDFSSSSSAFFKIMSSIKLNSLPASWSLSNTI